MKASARENNQPLIAYAARLKEALKVAVADGIVTADLKGKTSDPSSEQIVDLHGVFSAVRERLEH